MNSEYIKRFFLFYLKLTVINFQKIVSQPDGSVGDDNDEPGEENEKLGVGNGPYGKRWDGKDDSEKSVTGHENKSVDRHIGTDIDDVLNSATPETTKRPVHENIVAGGERYTDKNEEEIGDSKIEDQQVCCVLHLRVGVNL